MALVVYYQQNSKVIESVDTPTTNVHKFQLLHIHTNAYVVSLLHYVRSTQPSWNHISPNPFPFRLANRDLYKICKVEGGRSHYAQVTIEYQMPIQLIHIVARMLAHTVGTGQQSGLPLIPLAPTRDPPSTSLSSGPKTTSFVYRSRMSVKMELMRQTSQFLLTGSSLFSLFPTRLSFLSIAALLIYNDYWSTGISFNTLLHQPLQLFKV